MSLAATRELAAVAGVEPLELLRANRDRPWVWEEGSLAFARIAPGDVLRLPDGREIEIVRMGGASDFQTLAQNPEFAAAWQTVANQLTSEGSGPSLALELQAAQLDFANTFSSMISSPSAFGIDAGNVLKATTNYVVTGRTVAGAVTHIADLVGTAQHTGDPTPVFQAFTGTMVGALVTAGALTSGVGAAIVFGATLTFDVLKQIGIFGSPPSGTIIYQDGNSTITSNAPPTIRVGPLCWSTTAITIETGSPAWRRFPDRSVAADAQWYVFGQKGYFSWRGDVWNVPPTFGGLAYSAPEYRPIDYAFPDYHYVVCAAPPKGLETFNTAFAQAYIANKEYELNGLKSQPDAQVLKQVLRFWNRAHDGSSYVDVAPVDVALGNARTIGATIPSQSCPPNLAPLWQTQIRALVAVSNATDVAGSSNSGPAAFLTPDGQGIRVHTGPTKTVKKFLPLHLGAPKAAAPALGLSTGAKVGIGVGVAAVAGGGFWLAVGQPLTLAALKAAVSRLVGKL